MSFKYNDGGREVAGKSRRVVMIKAILIDAANKEVREIECKDFDDVKRQMGVEWVSIGFSIDKHDCFVDDEGLMNNPKHFFTSDFGYQPYAGNGAILRRTPCGDSVSCKISLETIKKSVKFYDLADIQTMIRAGEVEYATYFKAEGEPPVKLDEQTLGAFD